MNCTTHARRLARFPDSGALIFGSDVFFRRNISCRFQALDPVDRLLRVPSAHHRYRQIRRKHLSEKGRALSKKQSSEIRRYPTACLSVWTSVQEDHCLENQDSIKLQKPFCYRLFILEDGVVWKSSELYIAFRTHLTLTDLSLVRSPIDPLVTYHLKAEVALSG